MTALMSVFRPFMMLGLATETMVVSIRIMKKPITRDQSAGHGRATFSMRFLRGWCETVDGLCVGRPGPGRGPARGSPRQFAGAELVLKAADPGDFGAQRALLELDIDPVLA